MDRQGRLLQPGQALFPLMGVSEGRYCQWAAEPPLASEGQMVAGVKTIGLMRAGYVWRRSCGVDRLHFTFGNRTRPFRLRCQRSPGAGNPQVAGLKELRRPSVVSAIL